MILTVWYLLFCVRVHVFMCVCVMERRERTTEDTKNQVLTTISIKIESLEVRPENLYC